MKNYIILVIIGLVVIGGGYWWFNQPTAAAREPATGSDMLVGSGTIEAETVAITAELGGRVVDLRANEGDQVKAGQTLVELDKADLLAQQMQLEVALVKAQANLELVSAPPRPEDVAAAEAQLTQAETARDGAKVTWLRFRELVANPLELEAKINQAKAQVTQAEYSLEQARVNLKRLEIGAEATGRSQATILGGNEGLVQHQATQYQVQAAQTGVEMAKTALAGAQKQVQHLVQIRNNPLPIIVQANAAEAAYRQAEAGVLAAQANLEAVKAGPMAEDVNVAQAQAHEAEKAAAAVKAQLAKQTLSAPRAGLISKKLVEEGELASPGTTLLELSDIETVDLTVYIPETQIGRVKIGQPARVIPDAYPDQFFEGFVSFIAHEAEFTPRNVQTQEERANLVFAVKITLNNADHRLRPGMPADAEILLTSAGRAAAAPSPVAEVEAEPTPTPTPISAAPTVKPTLTPTIPATSQVKVVAWALNVRSGPGVDQPVIATLAQGDIAPILHTDPATGWLLVQLPNGQASGWITGGSSYVAVISAEKPQPRSTALKSAPISTATPVFATAGQTRQVEVVSAGLNVRSGPGTEYPIVATLLKGYTVSVTGVDPITGWLQIPLPGSGQVGWISGDPIYVAFK